MLSLEKLRKIDPELEGLSDEDVLKIQTFFYELGQIIYEDWLENSGSKNPVGVLRDLEKDGKIKT